MSIVYSLIARQQNVLCEHTDKSGNFPTVTRAVLKHLADQDPKTSVTATRKSVFPYNEFNFFFLHEDGLTFMCMAEDKVHANVAFMALGEVKTAFLNQYHEQVQTALAYGMSAFSSTLDEIMKKYDNYKVETPLMQLMERGEKIDLLVMRTEKLQQDALKYEKTARKVKNVYWWKNMKYWIILIFCMGLLAFVVSVLVCGIDFSSCGEHVEEQLVST